MQDECEEEEEEKKKRRSLSEFWGDGVPAFTVEQRHLEVFTSALTQRTAQAQQLHHSWLHTIPPPSPHTHTYTKSTKSISARAEANKHICR